MNSGISTAFVYTKPATQEYPESYFEPTSSELAKAHSATSKRLESQYEAPLKTRVIREREEKQRKARWPTVSDVRSATTPNTQYRQLYV